MTIRLLVFRIVNFNINSREFDEKILIQWQFVSVKGKTPERTAKRRDRKRITGGWEMDGKRIAE